MVKLRLVRVGRHKSPHYRLVATDSRTKVQGGCIEILGNYEPHTDEIKLSEDAVISWLKKGAQPSETVRSILKDKGIWAKFVATKKTTKPSKPKVKKTPTVVKKKVVKKTPAK